MKKILLLHVDYTNGTAINGRGSFWADSMLNNTEVQQKENESINDTVKRAIEEIDFAKVSYNGKPVNDIFVDTKDGGVKQIGYIYRVKHHITDRNTGFVGDAVFDAWVKIKEVRDINFNSK